MATTDEEDEDGCDCFLKDAATCAQVLELDVAVCPCECHDKYKEGNGSLPSES
jgi:hypothetical protein